MERKKIKPTGYLTVFHTLEDLTNLIRGDVIVTPDRYTQILGRLCSKQGEPKPAKYIPPICELLNSTFIEIEKYNQKIVTIKIYEVKLSGSSRDEFNIQGWCLNDSYVGMTRPL